MRLHKESEAGVGVGRRQAFLALILLAPSAADGTESESPLARRRVRSAQVPTCLRLLCRNNDAAIGQHSGGHAKCRMVSRETTVQGMPYGRKAPRNGRDDQRADLVLGPSCSRRRSSRLRKVDLVQCCGRANWSSIDRRLQSARARSGVQELLQALATRRGGRCWSTLHRGRHRLHSN